MDKDLIRYVPNGRDTNLTSWVAYQLKSLASGKGSQGRIRESFTPREKMRALLASKEFTHPVSVYDSISARMAEELGFNVGIFASSIASATVLGAPDLALLTLTEFAQQLTSPIHLKIAWSPL